MTFAKAMFHPLRTKDSSDTDYDENQALQVMFNPKELNLERSMSFIPSDTGKDAAQMHETGATNFSLSMTLYFDTYESGLSVRKVYMERLERMTKLEEGAQAGSPASGDKSVTPIKNVDNAPKGDKPKPEKTRPTVLFIWGAFTFRGVIESLSQKYTMFLTDGTPVRAEATIKMRQTADKDDQSGGVDLDTKGTPAINPEASKIMAEGAQAFNEDDGTAAFDDPMAELSKNKSIEQQAADAAKGKGVGGALGAAAKRSGAAIGEAVAMDMITGNKTGMLDDALGAAGNTRLFGDSKVGNTLNALASGDQTAKLMTLQVGGKDVAIGGIQRNHNGSFSASGTAQGPMGSHVTYDTRKSEGTSTASGTGTGGDPTGTGTGGTGTGTGGTGTGGTGTGGTGTGTGGTGTGGTGTGGTGTGGTGTGGTGTGGTGTGPGTGTGGHGRNDGG